MRSFHRIPVQVHSLQHFSWMRSFFLQTCWLLCFIFRHFYLFICLFFFQTAALNVTVIEPSDDRSGMKDLIGGSDERFGTCVQVYVYCTYCWGLACWLWCCWPGLHSTAGYSSGCAYPGWLEDSKKTELGWTKQRERDGEKESPDFMNVSLTAIQWTTMPMQTAHEHLQHTKQVKPDLIIKHLYAAKW